MKCQALGVGEAATQFNNNVVVCIQLESKGFLLGLQGLVVTGELPSWAFISVNAILLRIDYLILFKIFSRICAQSGVYEYISSAIY